MPVFDLPRFSKHVLYEGRSLLMDACALREGAADGLPMPWRGVCKDAILEAFAVHFRSTLDFLCNRGTHEDDAFAKHYVPTWAPPTLTPTLAEARTRVHKEIAHLTTERIAREGNKDWYFINLAGEVKTIFEAFLRSVSAAHLDPTALAEYLAAANRFDNPSALLVPPATAASGNPTSYCTAMLQTAKAPITHANTPGHSHPPGAKTSG